jgi:PelA/Pel-15E family pectate lyase
MAAVLNEAEAGKIAAQKKTADATIDNQSTYTQLAYLARVIEATGNEHLKEPFFKGLDYLLSAQYQNGGWPQFYPNPSGYQKHITFNDDDDWRNAFVARYRAPAAGLCIRRRNPRAHCARAVTKGVECILKCQIKEMAGEAWCAQHDEITFQPAPARTYEKISLSGARLSRSCVF